MLAQVADDLEAVVDPDVPIADRALHLDRARAVLAVYRTTPSEAVACADEYEAYERRWEALRLIMTTLFLMPPEEADHRIAADRARADRLIAEDDEPRAMLAAVLHDAPFRHAWDLARCNTRGSTGAMRAMTAFWDDHRDAINAIHVRYGYIWD
jgi:hypothetical protein